MEGNGIQLKEIKKPSGKIGYSIGGDFYIDCNCSSKEGVSYSAQNEDWVEKGIKKIIGDSVLTQTLCYRGIENKKIVTYSEDMRVIKELVEMKSGDGSELELICRGCESVFSISKEDIKELEERGN